MRIALAFACALVLAGCGADPTTGTTFSPPPGWKQLPSMFGFKMWLDPSKGSHSVVMLFKLPNKANVDFQKDIDFSRNPYYHGGSITKKSAITICGNHPAEYLLSQDTSANGKSGEAEIVLTTWGQDTYMALYAHSNGDKLTKAAQAAIRTICVK